MDGVCTSARRELVIEIGRLGLQVVFGDEM